MKKEIIRVPAKVRYISDWTLLDGGYSLTNYRFTHILDKKLTGCGFTEYCLSAPNINIVICSPRKILLDNKLEQHKGDANVYYFRSEADEKGSTVFDKDLINIKSKKTTNILSQVQEFLSSSKDSQQAQQNLQDLLKRKAELKDKVLSSLNGKGSKILVTYDSFRYVKDTLSELGLLDRFFVVVDEFQSIFTDSKFKSDTEIELLDQLSNIEKVCYVSATPMLDKYLDMLDEFKDLPYYEFDWVSEDPGRIVKPEIAPKQCRSILTEASRVIQEYLSGQFDKSAKIISGKLVEIESREAVIYVNSVANICSLIIKNKLTPENTNVLCSKDSDNSRKVQDAFRKSCGRMDGGIGKVPVKGEQHKMFTLCTRTVYLGADFYSTNARTFIFSDANIDSLSVDITLDLPQILGRQRLDENPWKNRAELYYKSLSTKNSYSEEDFKAYIDKKTAVTTSLLEVYKNTIDSTNRHNLAMTYSELASLANYKNNYVAVNKHSGNDLVPVMNNLVKVSEIRSFEMQQIEYRDRVSVIAEISSGEFEISFDKVEEVYQKIVNTVMFPDKLRILCNTDLNEREMRYLLKQLPIIFENYYNVLGPDRIISLSYRNELLKADYNAIKVNQSIDVSEQIFKTFKLNAKYSRSSIKEMLGKIYQENGLIKTPKAVDLIDYFEVRECNVPKPDGTGRDKGYEIINKKV